ncbi:hypothetical protein B0H14DRAFT_2683584, partial [Mycena olivaceomarginata]
VQPAFRPFIHPRWILSLHGLRCHWLSQAQSFLFRYSDTLQEHDRRKDWLEYFQTTSGNDLCSITFPFFLRRGAYTRRLYHLTDTEDSLAPSSHILISTHDSATQSNGELRYGRGMSAQH